MRGITLKSFQDINEFLAIHSLVLTIQDKKWHILTEDVFKNFKESLHYDIDYRIDGNFQFNNIILMNKFDEIRVTDKNFINITRELADDSLSNISDLFRYSPLYAYSRED